MIRIKFLKGAAYFTYMYLFIMFVMTLFFNKPGVFVFSIPLQVFCFVLGACLFFGMLFLFRKKLSVPRVFDKNDKMVVILALVSLFFIQILFVSQFYHSTSFDSDYIYYSAQKLQHPDFGPQYFSIYPNNLLLLFFERAIYKIYLLFGAGLDFFWVLVLINIIAIDVSLFLIYILAKKIFSREIAQYSLLLGVLLLGLMPWLTSIYSDTLSMPISLLIFYLYWTLKEQSNIGRKICCAFLIGCLLTLGFLLKPSTIFIGIAIVLIEALMFNYKSLIQNSKQFVMLVCTSLAILFGMCSVHVAYDYVVDTQQLVEYDATRNFPFTHWMMMGLKESKFKGNVSYGFWNSDDFQTTYQPSQKEAKIKANIAVIKERLKSFGIFGYLQYLWNKSIWILGDGTFFWGDEGVRAGVSTQPGIAQHVQQFVYPSGTNHHYYAYILQTSWFVVFFALIMVLFVIKKYATKEFFILSCTIFGSILFILLFEGRSRYIMNNLGFYIIVSGLGVEQILTLLNGMIARQREKATTEIIASQNK